MACRDCQFSLNQTGAELLEAQLGVQGYWALCSQDCKRQFLRNWLHLHFEIAAQFFGNARVPSSCLEPLCMLQMRKFFPG